MQVDGQGADNEVLLRHQFDGIQPAMVKLRLDGDRNDHHYEKNADEGVQDLLISSAQLDDAQGDEGYQQEDHQKRGEHTAGEKVLRAHRSRKVKNEDDESHAEDGQNQGQRP